MYPTETRIKALQERFGVHNGRFFGYYRFKNLNWYYTNQTVSPLKEEWFCYGDVTEEDIPRLQSLLEPNELLTLGWNELGPDEKNEGFHGDGHGIWMIIGHNGVLYDTRRDRQRIDND